LNLGLCPRLDAPARNLDSPSITPKDGTTMNVTTSPASLAGVSAAEWQIRCDLAALYRLVAHHRWTDFIYTHLSARLPGPDHHFLINRYGVNFHEMRASDLVKIDTEGRIVEPDRGLSSSDVNAAGFTIHSAVHMARPDLMCVIHTHTPAGIAVSAQKDGLLPLSQHACMFYGHLAYHGYEGIALDLEERDRLVHDLGQHKAMILRNHGLLVGGASIAEAFHTIYMLERACAAQIAALSGGREIILPPPEVCAHTAEQFRRSSSDAHYAMAWNAALRLVEDTRPDYRS
jgi:ribulose-5-phosphate 4-epimerase/fuculose-1-phosphate aldolase